MNVKFSPARRRLLVRALPVLVVYFIAIGAIHLWLGSGAPPMGPAIYLAALTPGVLILVIIWAVGRYLVEETDEYVKARLVGSILWALGITLAASTVWGFLKIYANAYRVPTLYVFILFCGAFAVIQFSRKIADRR